MAKSSHNRVLVMLGTIILFGILGVKHRLDSPTPDPALINHLQPQVLRIPTSTATEEATLVFNGHVGQLLLTIEPFPEGWHIWPPCADSSCTTEAFSETNRTILSPNEFSGKAIQDVFWFETPQEAYQYWARLSEVYNLQQAGLMTYQSRYATDEGMWCGIHRIPLCYVVTRYRNIVNMWYIHIDLGQHPMPSGMKMEDAEKVFRAADTHIGETLGLPELRR